ncbi:hypothetical protein D9758_006281 [Tetrapyrgos nigripes]|uniref:MYND-type domain-containing protein n=1 Tax=Tetrapyrgos nigripes TaxID=182062 RepID=A0A8H5G0F9_9AGAR|nr:hypothetical protein D9758_006281 [Tetrapyrgos nigripes]
MYIEVVVPPYGPLKPDGMKLGLFPTVGVNGNFTPWNIHLLPLDRLPVIDIKVPGTDKWLCTLMGSQMSARERSLKKHERHNEDTLMAVKDTIHSIILCAAGAAMVAGVPQSHPRLVFALRDKASQNCDTIFFISDLRYDLTCHSVVFDGYVLPLSEGLMEKIRVPFGRLVREGNIYNIGTYEGETEAWKQLIPAFVERCRTWTHKPNCEYVSTGKVPLTEEFDEVPICSCGRGKDVDGLMKREMGMWGDFAPYVTRIAISPLFAVSYLEAIVRDPEARRCFVCRGKGKPRIKTCAKCKKVRYCSEVCQKKDWQKHKKVCKA